jgi:hypothetical protein
VTKILIPKISQLAQRIFIILVVVEPKNMMMHMTTGSNYQKERITITGKRKYYIN